MGSIVKPHTFADATPAEASEVNDNFDTIYNAVNGNLDQNNLATNAVVEAKITDSSVTANKLASDAVTTTKILNDAVTVDKFTNPYCFRLEGSTTTLTDSTNIKVAFTTEAYDYSSMVATSTFTAPFAGVWHIGATVLVGATSTGVLGNVKIYKNGSAYSLGSSNAVQNNASWNVSADILLAANDTIEIYGFQNSAGDEAIDNATPALNCFYGHLVQKA